MDRPNAGERAFATATETHREPEAIEFVRFCYRRRRVGWPELYDEMCAVAGRGLYQGYGPEDFDAIGIGFGLFQMPALAVLVARVVAEDVERRRRTAAAIRTSLVAAEAEPTFEPSPEEGVMTASVQDVPVEPVRTEPARVEPAKAETAVLDREVIRLALVGA
jgi:hypothetical protein